jgi:catechol 2,3-dioxygenase-like lactoylglutathione lyase family enzyme
MRSCVVLGTNRFEAMVSFYAERLGFGEIDRWDQADGRAVFFQLPGLLLEIVDNDREQNPLMLGASLDRVGLVIEVENIDEVRDLLDIETPIPQTASWGARLFQLRDPDGLPVTFLERTAQH